MIKNIVKNIFRHDMNMNKYWHWQEKLIILLLYQLNLFSTPELSNKLNIFLKFLKFFLLLTMFLYTEDSVHCTARRLLGETLVLLPNRSAGLTSWEYLYRHHQQWSTVHRIIETLNFGHLSGLLNPNTRNSYRCTLS